MSWKSNVGKIVMLQTMQICRTIYLSTLCHFWIMTRKLKLQKQHKLRRVCSQWPTSRVLKRKVVSNSNRTTYSSTTYSCKIYYRTVYSTSRVNIWLSYKRLLYISPHTILFNIKTKTWGYFVSLINNFDGLHKQILAHNLCAFRHNLRWHAQNILELQRYYVVQNWYQKYIKIRIH